MKIIKYVKIIIYPLKQTVVLLVNDNNILCWINYD